MSATAAILLAAGSGKRMKDATEDKILLPLAGRPLFSYSAAAFAESTLIDFYVVVYRDRKQMLSLSAYAPTPTLFVQGGRERQVSVANALEALPPHITHVYIHDCARPFIRQEQLLALHKIVLKEDAVVLAHPVTDTIKQHSESGHLKTIDRSQLWAMETPQVFSRELITKAYDHVKRYEKPITDDAAAVELLKHPVAMLKNEYPNPKLTTPSDIPYFEYLLSHPETKLS